MWIERITAEDFLLFRKVSVEFDRGLNVVAAPNEGGKSSLMRAITTALFVDASSRSAAVKSLARWGRPDLFRIELDMELEGRRHRLVRDFRTKEQTISVEGETSPAARGKSVEEYLRSRLPLSDQELYLRVSAVRHEELSRVGEGDSNIGERLEEILGGSGGSATPARAAAALDAKRRDLLRGVDHPAKEENWGAVKRFSEERREAELAFQNAREAARRREELARTLAERRIAIEGLAADIESLKIRRERADLHRDLAERAAAARAKAEDIRADMERIRRLADDRDRSAAALAPFPERLREADVAALGGLRAELDREAALAGERIGLRAARGAHPAPLVAGIVIAAGGVLFGRLWHPALYLVAAVGALLFAWGLLRRTRGAAAASTAGEDESARLAAHRSAWAGARPVSEARALLEDAVRLKEILRDSETRLAEAARTAPGGYGESLQRLDAEYGRMALEARALDERRAELEPFAADADRMLAMETELAGARTEYSRLQDDIERLELSLAAISAPDAAAAEERLAGAAENLERAERKARVLEIAAEALEEARRGVSGSLAARLPARAERYLSLLTGGRYESLAFDPRTLAVTTVPASGDGERGAGGAPVPPRVEPESLSRGARDLLYVAVRFALAELFGTDEGLPLLLDDPFVHLDTDRRARAVDLVREFARSRQVVLFTCDSFYRGVGGRVIELVP